METVESLLGKAKIDYELAVYTLEKSKFDELFLESAALHCQQCMEKTLRYILSRRYLPLPENHDLKVLLDMINDKTLSKWFRHAHNVLNQWGVNNYFEAVLIADTGAVERAVALCEKAIKYVEELYPIPDLNSRRRIENSSIFNKQ